MANNYIYEGQTHLRIQMEGCGDLTGLSDCFIKYGIINSDKTVTYVGSFDATVLGLPTAGIIYYDLGYEDIITPGAYTWWAYITFPDGTVSITRAIPQTIKSEGEFA